MTKTNLLIVASGWNIYDIGDMTVSELTGGTLTDAPQISMIEALVAMGKVKRIASIHSFNSMSDETSDEDAEDGPFYTGGDDEGN